MKKKYGLIVAIVLLIVVIGIVITICTNRGYKLLLSEEDALTDLREAISESETYGATVFDKEEIEELEKLVKNYNKKGEWFSSSALSYYGYGKTDDNGKYEVTTICDGEYGATFKTKKKKDNYYLVDYTFEKTSEEANKIYIVANEESQIKKYDMDIQIDKKGTATITETWIANVNKGTEGYHSYNNLGKSDIKMLSASMDGKEYTIENNWNESGTLSDKSYKAGVYKTNDNNVDVVFGISEYGSHTYKYTYQITNFVSNLLDSDMVNWTLFPYGFGLSPNNVTIRISGPTEYPDSLDISVYGRKGSIQKVKNGSIYITSNGRISSDEYITLLAKFPVGTFDSTSKIEQKFDYYRNRNESKVDI